MLQRDLGVKQLGIEFVCRDKSLIILEWSCMSAQNKCWDWVSSMTLGIYVIMIQSNTMDLMEGENGNHTTFFVDVVYPM